MKLQKFIILFVTICIVLSGCRRENADNKHTVTEPVSLVEEDTEIENESITAEVTDVSSEEPTEEAMVTIRTGMSGRILEKDGSKGDIDRVDEYLDKKQFALAKLMFIDEDSWQSRTFKGDETERWTDQEWELIQSLDADAFRGEKIDYDNDGEAEIFCRSMSEELKITGYKINLEKGKIIQKYDMLGPFQKACADEGDLRQFWFHDIEGTTVCFCFFTESKYHFMVYALLAEGDEISVLEKRELTVDTKIVPESDADREEDIMSARKWDLTGETYGAYDLTTAELKKLQREPEIADAAGDTGLPQELVTLLKDILIRQRVDEEISVEDILRPYEAEEYQVDAENKIVRHLMEASIRDNPGISVAYAVDLDGDGKEEVIMQVTNNGSFGGEDIEIWRQNDEEENSFTVKRYENGVYDYTGLLSIEGQFYYIAETYDYSSKEQDRFFIFSFLEDGTHILQEIKLESQGTKKWTKLYRSQEADAQIVNSLETYVEEKGGEIEDNADTTGQGSLKRIRIGSAEVPYTEGDCDFSLEAFDLWEKDSYLVDFDNDGELECIYKWSVSPSSRYHPPQHLVVGILDKRDNYVNELEIDFPSFSFKDSGTYNWQFWLEEMEGKTYIFRLQRIAGTSDFVLQAETIQEGKFMPLLHYLLVDEKICKFEKSDWEYDERYY